MASKKGKFISVDGKLYYESGHKRKNLNRKLKAQGYKTIKGRCK